MDVIGETLSYRLNGVDIVTSASMESKCNDAFLFNTFLLSDMVLQ